MFTQCRSICFLNIDSLEMFPVKEPEESEATVDEMRCLAKHRPHTSVLGKDFQIYTNVYHPDTSCDITKFMNEEILKVLKDELMKKSEEATFDFLEIGCGAGYTAILAALASEKCKVWATDINDIAVKNTIENAKLHGVDDRLTAMTADVFDHEEIAGKEFDMIYWNLPWFVQSPEPGAEVDMLMRSLVDPGYEAFRRYLSHARRFLKKTGRIFVSFSFNLGSKELFKRVVNETGWSYHISSRNIFLVEVADEQNEVEVSIVELSEREE